MLLTEKEIWKLRRFVRNISKELTELEKMLDSEMTILGVPGGCTEEDFELETGQVEYDAEQCARNK